MFDERTPCGVPRRRSPRGITLVETLVAVLITAILLGILLVVLRGVMGRAGAVKSLSNLRQIGATLAAYTEAHDGRYPYVEPGEPVSAAPPGTPGNFRGSFSPVWMLDKMWPTLMHDVAPWPDHFETWLSPGHDREPPYWPTPIGFSRTRSIVSYQYSNSFVGSPRLWSGRADADQGEARPVLASSVRHPTRKVVMFDAERAYLRADARSMAARPVLLAGGSASLRFDRNATRPVKNPLNDLYDGPRRYHDTLNAVEGWDF